MVVFWLNFQKWLRWVEKIMQKMFFLIKNSFPPVSFTSTSTQTYPNWLRNESHDTYSMNIDCDLNAFEANVYVHKTKSIRSCFCYNSIVLISSIWLKITLVYCVNTIEAWMNDSFLRFSIWKKKFDQTEVLLNKWVCEYVLACAQSIGHC